MIDFIDAVVGEADKQCHFGIIFRSLLKFDKIFADIWKLIVESSIKVSSNDNFDIVPCDNVEYVVLLIYLW